MCYIVLIDVYSSFTLLLLNAFPLLLTLLPLVIVNFLLFSFTKSLVNYSKLMNWQNIFKIYSNRCTLIFNAATALIIFSLSYSQALANETEPRPIGYAKAGPLKETIEKITAVARKIQPSPQVESLPYMVGMMLGDPTLASVSATENITVFIYNSSSNEEATYLALVKLTEDSPIRNALSLQSVIVEDRGGWSLISRDQFLLDQIEDIEGLIRLAQKERGADIEIGFWLNRIQYPVESIKYDIINRLEREGRIKDEADRATIEGVIDIIIGELMSLESLLTGINITPDALVIQSNIKAKSETALSRLFSQKLVRDIPVGEYLSADSSLTYWFRFDPKDSSEYVNHILNAVIDVSQKEWRSLMISFKDLYDKFLQGIDGTSVGSFELNKMMVKMKQLGGTDLNSSEFADLIEEGIKLTEDLINIINIDSEIDITPLYIFQRDAFAVNGVSVHTLKSRFNNTDDLDAGEESEEEKSFVDQTYYYAVSNGVYLNASDRKSINEIINQVTSGQPTDRNLNTVFRYKEGMLGQLRVDLKRSLMMTIENQENITPEFAAAVGEKIESAVMEPIFSELRLRNSRLSIGVKATWESMANWAAIMQMINQGPMPEELPVLEPQ